MHSVACRRRLLIGLGTLAPAQAANWLEMNFYLSGPNYDGELPPCEAALGKIAARFCRKGRPVLELRPANPRLRAGARNRLPALGGGNHSAPLLHARSPTSATGVKHRVNYWIGEDTGMIGMTWGVEWCVVGLDRNWAYNPACKMARP